ncbi:Glutaredoxin domain-containing cysteine-rich protein 2 [Bagarius yarrelli]|uniref:Glutaredoxin domain-containing cysteine-rich protein 2 n=1 Tax=Bagarius yarrelli TaxID=175774 RepID=A0A556V9I0_BAGYA|nr:Glutaredoxin domain-containing cysteine-rich protein 2 [Bagarius yarrelli]
MRVAIRERFKIRSPERECPRQRVTASQTRHPTSEQKTTEMEESTRMTAPRHEGKPRKVRFKLASSYSGRVLKHVYEDGQELDSPEEKYPHSFIHTKIPQHLDVEQLCSFEEVQEQDGDPPAGLIAQRINIYRTIIIYTSNLKIIRAPGKRAEREARREGRAERREGSPGQESRSKGRHRMKSSRKEERRPAPKVQDAGGCKQCGGSGSAPCSRCHGSKLSMLANRFNESIRELRCPACDLRGLEPCQSCVLETYRHDTILDKQKRSHADIQPVFGQIGLALRHHQQSLPLFLSCEMRR